MKFLTKEERKEMKAFRKVIKEEYHKIAPYECKKVEQLQYFIMFSLLFMLPVLLSNDKVIGQIFLIIFTIYFFSVYALLIGYERQARLKLYRITTFKE